MRKWILFLVAFIFILSLPQMAEASSNQLIIINKSTNQLAFFEKGKLVRTFPVATGRSPNLTPNGRFPIVNKIKNRPYYSGNIPGGHPRNPLGDRWLGLQARGTYGTTYAIHGNNNESSIGKYVSAGCVRMHNKDVRWLFDQVQIRTDAIILNSSKSFEQIAKDNGYKLESPIKVMIDGKELKVSEPPFIENNRVLVPMRSIFNSLGASVHWDAKTRSITGTHNNNVVKLTVGSRKATVNDKAVTLDVAPVIRNSQTFVPTRFVSEALGAQIDWSNSIRTVTIHSPPKPEPKPEPKPPVEPKPARTPIDVFVNGEKVIDKSREDAFVVSGITMVPMREIFQWLGAEVVFDSSSSTVTATREGQKLMITSRNKTAVVNGQNINLPLAPFIENGKMYVPARAVTDVFSGKINWDGSKWTVYIDVEK